MNTLAGVFSEVAAYEFTTLTTVPGVIKYKVKATQFSESEYETKKQSKIRTHVKCQDK